jgi:hypothetical protein
LHRVELPRQGDDLRLKVIELVGTLSGFLAIIISLEQAQFSRSIDLIVVLFVLLIISCVLLYGAIMLHFDQRRMNLLTAMFTASFSGIVVVVFAVAMINALGYDLSEVWKLSSYNLGALVIIVVALLVFFLIMFWSLNRVMNQIMKGVALGQTPTEN